MPVISHATRVTFQKSFWCFGVVVLVAAVLVRTFQGLGESMVAVHKMYHCSGVLVLECLHAGLQHLVHGLHGGLAQNVVASSLHASCASIFQVVDDKLTVLLRSSSHIHSFLARQELAVAVAVQNSLL